MTVKSFFQKSCLLIFLLLDCFVCLNLPGKELSVRIIQTTDLHGSIEHGRLARTAALTERETMAAGGPEKSLRIDCGDLIQGTYAMTFPEGRELMIRVLNRLNFDVFVPGNHDFEFGAGALLEPIRKFQGTVLAANLAWPEAPLLPWRIFRRSGLNIAVIGIAYPALDKMFLPPVLGKAQPLPAEKQIERIMPRIMRSRPDLILLAVHGSEQTWFAQNFNLFNLIRKYPQIDLVLCGHTHQAESGCALGRSSWRIQAPALANGIAIADITFDTAKKRIVSMKTRIALIEGVREHPEIKKMVKAVSSRTFRQSRQCVGRVPVELRSPEKKEHSTHLTRLYGKAIMEHTGAQLAFYGVNSRFRLGPGNIDQFQLFRLMPFADHPVTAGLTGSEIRAILEEQLAIQRKHGMYQAPAGIRFSLYRKKIRNLSLESGSPLEPGKLYQTAFSSYICAGSGRCPVLHSILKSKNLRFHPLTVREITAGYLKKYYPAE